MIYAKSPMEDIAQLLGNSIQKCRKANKLLKERASLLKVNNQLSNSIELQETIDKLLDLKFSFENGILKSSDNLSLTDAVHKLTNFLKIQNHSLKDPKLNGGIADISQLIQPFLKPQWKLMLVAMVSCPWYSSLETDSTKLLNVRNLFVIYRMSDEEMFQYPLLSVQNGVSSQSCVSVIEGVTFLEVNDWIERVVEGFVNYLELLFLPDHWRLYESEEWIDLITTFYGAISFTASKKETNCSKYNTGILLTKSLRKRLHGQAISAVIQGNRSSAKSPQKTTSPNEPTGTANPSLSLSPSASTLQLSTSLRLLSHLNCLTNGRMLFMDGKLVDLTSNCSYSRLCYYAIEDFIGATRDQNVTQQHKDAVVSTLIDWDNELISREKVIEQNNPTLTKREHFTWLENWYCSIRIRSRSLQSSLLLSISSPNGLERVEPVLRMIESACPGKLPANLTPDRVLLASRAGSSLYNLAVKSSDTDFILVYVEPTDCVLKAVVWPGAITDAVECRGPALSIEFGAYEVGKAAQLLIKASVVILELVFIDPDRLEWASAAWRHLHKYATTQFLTEFALSQFLGYAKVHAKALETGRTHKANEQPGKVLYHVRHKLTSVRAMVKGNLPKIRMEDETEERDWILAARKVEDRGLASQMAEEDMKLVMAEVEERETRLREKTDAAFLADWVSTIRGWPSDK